MDLAPPPPSLGGPLVNPFFAYMAPQRAALLVCSPARAQPRRRAPRPESTPPSADARHRAPKCLKTRLSRHSRRRRPWRI